MQADDGDALTDADISDAALEATKKGMYALLDADLFNLLCIPPHKLSSAPDPPAAISMPSFRRGNGFLRGASGLPDRRSALWQHTGTTMPSFRHESTRQITPRFISRRCSSRIRCTTIRLEEFAPCGAVAGIMARTDANAASGKRRPASRRRCRRAGA